MLRRAARALTAALGDLLEELGTGISRWDLIDQIVRLADENTRLKLENGKLLKRLEGIDSPDAFEQGLFCDFCDAPSKDVRLRGNFGGNDIYQCGSCATRYPMTKGE